MEEISQNSSGNQGTNEIGSSSISLPPIWPESVLQEIEKNKDWKFEYNHNDPLVILTFLFMLNFFVCSRG